MINIKSKEIPQKARSKYFQNYGQVLYSSNNSSNNITGTSSIIKLITTDDLTDSSNNLAYSSLRIDQDFIKNNRIIKSTDNTTETNDTVYSSLNTKNKIDNISANINNIEDDIILLSQITETKLSKTDNDTAEGHITFNAGITVKSNTATNYISEAITELSEEEISFPITQRSRMIIEDSDSDNYEALSSAVAEVYNNEGGGIGNVNVIDSLDSDDEFSALSANMGRELNEIKADDFLLQGGTLYLTANGQKISKPVVLPGTGGIVLDLRNLISSSFSVAYKSDALLEFNVTSIDTANGDETGKVTVVYFVNNRRVVSQLIEQGEHSFNIGSYLSLGENTVRSEERRVGKEC